MEQKRAALVQPAIDARITSLARTILRMMVPAAEDEGAEEKEEAIKPTMDLTWYVIFTSFAPDSAFELCEEDQWMLMVEVVKDRVLLALQISRT